MLFWMNIYLGNLILLTLLGKYQNLYIGIIHKASFSLSKSSLFKLYYSLVYPYLQYCLIDWGSTYATNLKRIILLQKRIIRIINKETFNAHTDPLFA